MIKTPCGKWRLKEACRARKILPAVVLNYEINAFISLIAVDNAMGSEYNPFAMKLENVSGRRKTMPLSFNDRWEMPEVPEHIIHGDMPGDKIKITDEHIRKAGIIYPVLRDECRKLASDKIVIAVHGGSGVGKSEIASILGYLFQQEGIGVYVMSGDNYPWRIPKENDIERARIYRTGGMRGLLAAGLVTPKAMDELHDLWAKDLDAEKTLRSEYDWLETYQEKGAEALAAYLGSQNEHDYIEVSEILDKFHRGEKEIFLKRMGRELDDLWYEKVDFSGIDVLILEWTHGNSDNLTGVDIPILLNSTPEETLAHRKARNRDGKPDSPMITQVLELEQKMLDAEAHKAKIIVSKAGELLTYDAYRKLMDGGQK